MICHNNAVADKNKWSCAGLELKWLALDCLTWPLDQKWPIKKFWKCLKLWNKIS